MTAFFWVSHDKRHGCFVEFIKKLTEDISALMYYMTSRRTKILNKLPKQACDMYLSSRRKPLLNNKYGVSYGAKEIWAYLCMYAKPTCSLKSSTWSNIEPRVHWVSIENNSLLSADKAAARLVCLHTLRHTDFIWSLLQVTSICDRWEMQQLGQRKRAHYYPFTLFHWKWVQPLLGTKKSY